MATIQQKLLHKYPCHTILTAVFMKGKPCINMTFTYARYRAPRKARANNEELKFPGMSIKTKTLNSYENVMRL